jgi:hypothetical protein
MDPADWPQVLSKTAMHLGDLLRHEIEHTTQSGWNTKSSKFMPSDMNRRSKINSGELSAVNYFLLKKEIPAMIHGLHTKAKKSKQPFKQVVEKYLTGWVNQKAITADEMQTILAAWRKWLPKLAIRQEL